MEHVIGFAVMAGVLTLVPGLDTLLVLRSSVAGGRAAGFATTLGIVAGCLVWAVASAFGITGLLRTSEFGFALLQAFGAGYLIWLGIRSLWSVLRHDTKPLDSVERDGTSAISPLAGFRAGFTTNLLNPKVGIFYLSILPQFLPSNGNTLAWSLGLASIHALEGLIWLGALSMFVGAVRQVLMRPAAARALETVAGLALLGFGGRIAWEAQARLRG